ncbi:hypothetical protein [uncultured Nostoc sp.]|uniref:hypothetical protein n=1 Tax=uncultured Nostoc sp. TaxID=340711 RepID=UPI0035CBBC36
MSKFNQNLYNASLEALLSANVPQEIAQAASKIVASDDNNKENFGRSAQDQQVINEAMQYFHKAEANGK